MHEKLSSQTNALNWFEIPATDIARAKKFYESIFEIQMENMEMPDMKYAMFPFSPTMGKLPALLRKAQCILRVQPGPLFT